MRRPLPRWRLDVHRDGMLLVGFLVGLGQVRGLLPAPVDAVNYWLAGTSTDVYPDQWGSPGAGQWLYYPPPVVQLSRLIQPIGFDLFVILLSMATFLAMWSCARRWSFPLLALGVLAMVGIMPAFGVVFLSYVVLGNLQWILAALTLLAFRHPALWALQLVSKMTTALGWWWHPLRGEWRQAARGALAAAILLGISALASPDLWADFLRFGLRNGDLANPPMVGFAIPFAVRLPMAIALLVWGARTDRRWTVPIASGWALLVIWDIGFMPFVIAATRLVEAPRLPAFTIRRQQLAPVPVPVSADL
jgi:hypothetical protein